MPETKLTDGIYAKITTPEGEITARLFFKQAPMTVGNFVGLAEGAMAFTDPKTNDLVKRPFYDGLIFHRVIDNFMIQGGDPMGNGSGGPGYKFNNEIVAELKHSKPGILSMANAGPNTNGSQFFITLVPTPWLDGGYNIFGEVVEGQEVVNKIGKTEVKGERPAKDITMQVKIVRIGKEAEAFDAVKAFSAKKVNPFTAQLDKDKKAATKTKSGLMFTISKKGTGEKPKQGQTISAHYTGYLENGTKFDSSVDRGQPFETPIGVGRVIKGWDEAFLDMKVGEKRRLIIPSSLGYGERGAGGVIPPNATLIFDVELLAVK